MPDLPLSRLQLDILELEAASWRLPGSKHAEFRRRHPHVTETGYYVALNRLLDHPAAARRAPELINRLRRLRDTETARRAHHHRVADQ